MPVDPGAALVTRARNGDATAWRELHDRIAGRLLVWLRSQPHGDCSMDNDDIANETWFTAARRIADFTGDDDAFAGWVFGIARKHLLNANRRSYRRATTPTSIDPRLLSTRHEPDERDRPSEADQLDWIRQVLAQLPRREAEVVACLDVVGLDVVSTARALSLTSNAVRVSHHRALRRLRAILAAEQPTGVAAPRQALGSLGT